MNKSINCKIKKKIHFSSSPIFTVICKVIPKNLDDLQHKFCTQTKKNLTNIAHTQPHEERRYSCVALMLPPNSYSIIRRVYQTQATMSTHLCLNGSITTQFLILRSAPRFCFSLIQPDHGNVFPVLT